MTEEVINKLPEEMKTHICTLRKSSMDSTNNTSMCIRYCIFFKGRLTASGMMMVLPGVPIGLRC